MHHASRRSGAIVAGLVILGIGIGLLLENVGLLPRNNMWQYWPMILVVLGAVKLLLPEEPHDRISGLWFVFLGGWLQASLSQVYGLSFATSWPILLIAIGIRLLFARPRKCRIADLHAEVSNVR